MDELTIDGYFSNLLEDDKDILRSLSKLNIAEGDTVELISEIPARLHTDLIIAKVMCWKEIQEMYKCKLRIYAWVYRDDVEKYLLSLTQNLNNIYVTALPYTLKELNKCTTFRES